MSESFRSAKAQAALSALPEAQLHALRHAYAHPPRAYHNWQHVLELLGHYCDVEVESGWHKPAEILLAMLYHDAVYVPGRNDNEACSARLAARHLSQWRWDGVDIARVEELILATAHHGEHSPASVGDGANADDMRRFLDCDMAILGADAEAFDAFEQGIAEEYRSVVPGLAYRFKRRAFLRKLLKRPRIYLSDAFHSRFDQKARANLRRTLGIGQQIPAK